MNGATIRGLAVARRAVGATAAGRAATLGAQRKLLSAIEAVADIAYRSHAPVSSSELTRRQGMPRRYLEDALRRLVHAGILAGQRGSHGGYRLARERGRITVGEIARALQGENSAAGRSGSVFGRQVVAPLWRTLEDEVLGRLDSITVADLCARAEAAGVPRESGGTRDRPA